MEASSLWMHTPEWKWLNGYVGQLRDSAVKDIIAGLDPEAYAEMRGYIRAMDAVQAAPARYVNEVRRRQSQEVNNESL